LTPIFDGIEVVESAVNVKAIGNHKQIRPFFCSGLFLPCNLIVPQKGRKSNKDFYLLLFSFQAVLAIFLLPCKPRFLFCALEWAISNIIWKCYGSSSYAS